MCGQWFPIIRDVLSYSNPFILGKNMWGELPCLSRDLCLMRRPLLRQEKYLFLNFCNYSLILGQEKTIHLCQKKHFDVKMTYGRVHDMTSFPFLNCNLHTKLHSWSSKVETHHSLSKRNPTNSEFNVVIERVFVIFFYNLCTL